MEGIKTCNAPIRRCKWGHLNAFCCCYLVLAAGAAICGDLVHRRLMGPSPAALPRVLFLLDVGFAMLYGATAEYARRLLAAFAEAKRPGDATKVPIADSTQSPLAAAATSSLPLLCPP
ncbi:hypothetical protein M885DRAFT_572368 [Pelagophyceae sp. CCMP2097]|nr:hypothetical protein M885DRAFT_572368 [Pelagophyceae sp. CCMP2097]